MAHKNALEAINRTLKDLKTNQDFFGDALILLSDDFQKTLLVLLRSTSADELNAYLKSSVYALWQNIHKLNLKTNMRVQLQNDASADRFAKQLLDIENGKFAIGEPIQCITFPKNFCKITATTNELIGKVFPNIAQNYRNH